MQKYNLLDLLDGDVRVSGNNEDKYVRVNGIHIPIIQRDYAHGRKDEGVIRDRFLESIFTALVENNDLELDFVYGSIKEVVNGHSVFLPLDGQQRLTTLFLIYWYIGNRELKDDKLTFLREQLRNFSYETRPTSRLFCEKLSSISFEDDAAKTIFNSFWFHKIYEKDPTVMSMINMLKAIEVRYRQLDYPLFDRLSKLCFYVLPLDGFNLTDELYIKMNARGKQLTSFENLKADLINWMKDDRNPDAMFFHASVNSTETLVPFYLNVATKLDNSWTDIFWVRAKSKLKNEDKIVDDYFLRFINRFLLNEFIVGSPSSVTVQSIEQDDHFRYLYYGEEDGSHVQYKLFSNYADILNADVVSRMAMILDKLALHQKEITGLIRPKWNTSDDWFLYDEHISQTQRLLFLGVSLYLENEYFDEIKFSNWIRVVWNIIIDPDIRSIGVMINAMKLLKELAIGCEDIYGFFKTASFQKIINKQKNFFAVQLEEENLKSLLILNDNWNPYILRAEAHPLFRGNIRFLIGDEPELPLFVNRVGNAELLFTSAGSSEIIKNFGLLRYLVSQLGDWDNIYRFNYSNQSNNWELILRRDQFCINIMCSLLSLNDMSEIALKIQNSIDTPSRLDFEDGKVNRQIRKAHNSLYTDAKFFKWMQDNATYKMKHLSFHNFIIKPNAHYAKVMIDCYRNEIITKLNARYDLDLLNHRCGTSNFYWGESIEVQKAFGEMVVCFHFDNDKGLLVGLKKKNNPNITIAGSGDEDWVQKFYFNYAEVFSDLEADAFVIKIVDRLTSIESNCVFKEYL